MEYGIVYNRKASSPPLQAYVDAAFADDPGCRSTAEWEIYSHGPLLHLGPTLLRSGYIFNGGRVRRAGCNWQG